MFVGTSNDLADFGEDNIRGHSLSVRGGIRLPAVDVSLLGEHWTEWGDQRVNSALVEANYFPIGAHAISPYVVFGLGYMWFEDLRAAPDTDLDHGAAASFGAGVQTKLVGSSALRAEAIFRDDNGSFTGQLRASLGYAGASPTPSSRLPRATVDLVAYGMNPLSGPWRFVEPGYVVRYSRPYSDRLSGTLALGIFHWQIAGQRTLVNYLWDTRAFVGMPGVDFRVVPDGLLSVRGGPAVIAMGEGEDAGANLGAHIEAASILRPFGIPITLGVGTLWMPRGPNADSRVSGGDQIGLMISGGLHL